eukprot:428755_1
MRDPARTISQCPHSKFKSIGSSNKQVVVKKFLKILQSKLESKLETFDGILLRKQHIYIVMIMIGVVCIVNGIMDIINIVHSMTVISNGSTIHADLNILTEKTNINIQQYEIYYRYFDMHLPERIKSNIIMHIMNTYNLCNHTVHILMTK